MSTTTLSPTALAAGDRFVDRYRIEALLGMGGMGAVYRAFDESLGVPVALKLPILNAQGNSRNEIVLREAKVLSLLTHPGIPKVLHHGTSPEGLAFLAMELVEGIKLSELIASKQLPAFEARIEWLRSLASILLHIHQNGLIYADLKPENLIVCQSENKSTRLVLIDFGTCRLVSEPDGEPGRGTIDYMSPEQHLQGKLDGRSDIFSLGILAYELLTGVRPFVVSEGDRNSQRAKLGNLIATEDHIPARQVTAEVWPDVSALIDVCLEKRPEDRFRSMEEVLEGLQHVDGSSVFTHLWRGVKRSVQATLGRLGKKPALGNDIEREEAR